MDSIRQRWRSSRMRPLEKRSDQDTTQAVHPPVSFFTRFASSHPLHSPFSTTAISTPSPCTNSTISLSLFTNAGSLCRIFRVRQCTVKALTPVFMILSTSFFVSSWVGKRRIFADTVISGGSSLRNAVKIAHKRSGLVSNAAPMPECVLNGLGQPQLRSIPETSCTTVLAAWTANSGEAEPIWYMR